MVSLADVVLSLYLMRVYPLIVSLRPLAIIVSSRESLDYIPTQPPTQLYLFHYRTQFRVVLLVYIDFVSDFVSDSPAL